MTTANIITLIRIGFIPIYAVCFLIGTPACEITALVLFIVASCTDSLDGYIARHYNQVTTFGKFVDPLADKLLVLTAISLFVERGDVPGVAAAVIIAREMIVTTLRVVAMSEGKVLAAGITGKVKTFTQIVVIVMLLTPVADIAFLGTTLGVIGVWLMTAVTVISGVEYLWSNRMLLSMSVSKK